MSTPETTQLTPDEKAKRQLDLYKIYSDDLKKFDTICWQFPLALVSANFIALNWFRAEPLALLALSAINFLFLLPLAKHIHLRFGVVTALKNLEEGLKLIFEPKYVADFSRVEMHWWLRAKTLFILGYGLIALNSVFFISSVCRVFR